MEARFAGQEQQKLSKKLNSRYLQYLINPLIMRASNEMKNIVTLFEHVSVFPPYFFY